MTIRIFSRRGSYWREREREKTALFRHSGVRERTRRPKQNGVDSLASCLIAASNTKPGITRSSSGSVCVCRDLGTDSNSENKPSPPAVIINSSEEVSSTSTAQEHQPPVVVVGRGSFKRRNFEIFEAFSFERCRDERTNGTEGRIRAGHRGGRTGKSLPTVPGGGGDRAHRYCRRRHGKGSSTEHCCCDC